MFDWLGANPFLAESTVFTDFKGWGGGRDAGKYGVFTVTIRDDGLVQDQWLRLQVFFFVFFFAMCNHQSFIPVIC